MKKVALLFALAFVACSSDSNDPKVAITVLNDVVQPVVPGDIITLGATTANIGSPTFTWSVLGETVAGATGAQVSIRITDQITEPTTLEITVTATGSNGNNATVKATATVKFQAQPGTRTNATPVAVADTYSVGANGTLTAAVSVLANDVDDAYFGTLLRAVIVDTTAHGLLVLNSNGTFSYKPATDFFGTDTFRYRATDGLLASDPATVTINVTNTNGAPVAAADAYVIGENGGLSATTSVLANDTDDNFGGTSLTAALVTAPTNGTLILSPNGTFTYTPNADFFGTDTFVYTAKDGTLSSDLTKATITITQNNTAPLAVTDEFAMGKNGTLDTTISVLANDIDDNFGGTTLTAAIGTTLPAHGTLTFNANGTFHYLPTHDYIGLDSFTYSATDGSLSSAPATVNITVNDANQPPVAVADSYSTAQNTTLTATVSVLANDSDDDFDESGVLTAVLGTTTTHGTLTLNTDGTFTYVPTAGYEGPDAFTYSAKDDGALSSATATVTISVTQVNQPPVAVADATTINEDNVATIAAPGVLANDTDDLNATLTPTVTDNPANGTVVLNPNGGYTYTPNANYNGTDSFKYTVSDGTLSSGKATVTITINPVNDAPVAVADSAFCEEDTTLTVAAPGVLANDTDPVENSALTAVLVTGPLHGTLTLGADGSYTYVPNANYAGNDAFSYKANDGVTDSNVVTVGIKVTGVNDSPTATADSYSTTTNTPLVIFAPGLLANDTDVDGDTLKVDNVNVTGLNGVLSLDPGGNGAFQYTPSSGFVGTDTFTYRVRDPSLYVSSYVTVTITVTAP